MRMDTNGLREVAEAATDKPYSDVERSYLRAALSAQNPADGEFAATFDPPTVLGLLDRIAELEAEVTRLTSAR